MKKLFVVLLLIVIIASGCGQTNQRLDQEIVQETPEDMLDMPEESDNQNDITDEVVDQEEPEEPIIYPYTQPLTGIGTEEEQTARPIMVLVENSPAARPQSGLDQADIVYEVLAEGEITRFLAVFQSESPEVIGPVRSIRPYMVEIGDGLDALIVHAGWSQEAMNMLVERNLPHFDEIYGDGAYYWRSEERNAPHNLYTSVELIRKGSENKGFRQTWNDPGFTFFEQGETPEIEGESATKVNINYISGYYVDYYYNEEEEVYERYMLGEPHKDKESDNLLIASNIIVAKTGHQIVDDIGRRHIDVNGSGEGYLFQEGIAQEITWESKNGIIRVIKDGEELPLIPGKTWIHYIPLNSPVLYQ